MIELAERSKADIVAGWRKDRKDAFFSRRLPSMIANWIIFALDRRASPRLRVLAEVFRAEVEPMKLYGEMTGSCRRSPAIRRHHRRTHREPPPAIARAIELRSLGPSGWCWIC